MPEQRRLDELADRIRYVGNAYHKRKPGDFGLTPPALPRPDKTLCDEAGILHVAEAQQWLQEGARRGMVSTIQEDGFPKHVWAVTKERVVLEAKYNNEGPGHYHGYPLPENDPFRKIVLRRWDRE